MTVRRRFLNVGVFLVAAGAVILLVRSGAVDTDAVTRALSLWPLAVIAIGAGLIVRRTRLGLPGGMLAAAVPGLLLGGMIVAVPDLSDLAVTCGDPTTADSITRDGTFDGPASVDLSLACGEVTVTTAPGLAWRLDSSDGAGVGANVSSASDRLSVRSTGHRNGFWHGRGGDAWRLELPAGTPLDVRADVSAGRGRFDLAGARLGNVRLTVNAGEARLDLTSATVSRLDVEANAAAVSLSLPAASDLGGDLVVNAGSLRVCAPADLGLRVRGETVLGGATYGGLIRNGDAWESPNYSIATFHADLSISASVGSVAINPKGGCL